MDNRTCGNCGNVICHASRWNESRQDCSGWVESHPWSPATLDLIATGDIAKMAGVPADTVRQWVARGLMPAPLAITSGGKIWDREVVAAWLAKRGYPRT
jgi:hypothetical protein